SVAETEKKLQEVVNLLEIEEQIHKFPSQLSGGQRQRVACARALITQPELILADEPTGALDSANSKILMNTFRFMNEKLNSTILMVTHDAVIGSYASRVLFLKDGQIWNELHRGERDRQSMYHEILDAMVVLGGESDVR
ncbi:MAG: ABC transporter ATP-binding protein, partial [Lachnospiraceae bacterium]|nr:ABC transporter ATP-binding protein [Lachnospiraceae bacterium]